MSEIEKKRRRIALRSAGSALALLALCGQASAFCSQPSPPMFKPTKPTVPWCVNEWNNTHTCSDWEIDSYNSDVRQYRNEVDRYITGLNTYLDDAVAYAECEIRDL